MGFLFVYDCCVEILLSGRVREALHIYILGMRMRIFCLAPASQCVNSPTEAARARALLTAREASRLPYESARTAEITFLSVTN